MTDISTQEEPQPTSSITSYEMDDSLIARCVKCFEPPILTIPNHMHKEVYINCENCGYNSFELLPNYLEELKKLKQEEPNGKCIIHEQIITSFCETCKAHMCDKCNNDNHRTHQIISLSNVIDTKDLSDQIEKGYDHLKNYCTELKKTMVKRLNRQLNQLKYCFDSFQAINNEILFLMKLIIKNYNKNTHNYYLLSNVKNMGKINIYQCSRDKSFDDVINYYRNYFINKPLDVSNIKDNKTINEHKNGMYCLLLLKDGRIASSSYDKTIKIYNPNNKFHCDMTITGHNNGVTYLSQLENGNIISCSGDKTIKIWSFSDTTFNCEHTIENAHNDWIWKVIPISNSKLASCSKDKTIKIWDTNELYTQLQVLEGHTNEVKSIIQLKDKEILISGSLDNTLRIWNLLTYQCDKIINDIPCCWNNSILELDNKTTIIGGKNTLTMLNVSNFEIEDTIKNHQLGFVSSLILLKENHILCGCDEGKMCLFDKKTKTIQIKENAHTKTITDFININKQFISCSWDNTMTIWDY